MVEKPLPLPAAELQRTHSINSLVAKMLRAVYIYFNLTEIHEDKVVIGKSMVMSDPSLFACSIVSRARLLGNANWEMF